MSLYPSLEDMKVDQLTKAQLSQMQPQQHQAQVVGNAVPSAPTATLPYPLTPPSHNATLYPSLNEYMGLEITPELVAQYGPQTIAIREQNQVAVPASSGTVAMVAPLSGSSVGLRRAEVSHGIREVVLCKDKDGKIGVKVQEISKGIFVTLVQKNSPAALGGLRFGDQILQVNGTNVAGYDADKMHSMFKKCPPNNIVMAIRDRPFERTITLHKDSTGHIGFMHKNGKIHSLVKDSSAARNGILTDHQLLEVNGQNVVGLKEKDLSRIISEGGQVVTITIMPSFFYEHMMKKISSSLVHKQMDHSIREL